MLASPLLAPSPISPPRPPLPPTHGPGKGLWVGAGPGPSAVAVSLGLPWPAASSWLWKVSLQRGGWWAQPRGGLVGGGGCRWAGQQTPEAHTCHWAHETAPSLSEVGAEHMATHTGASGSSLNCPSGPGGRPGASVALPGPPPAASPNPSVAAPNAPPLSHPSRADPTIPW